MTSKASRPLETIAAILGIIASLLAIWEGAARVGLPVGDGPIGVVHEISDGSNSNIPTTPSIPGSGEQLTAPSGVSVSGDCESGYTVTWQPVEGADRYRIERDGFFAGSVTDADYSIQPFPDGKEHRYEVFAEAFPRPRSEASDEVVAGPCSF
jgi:hypothetical protein